MKPKKKKNKSDYPIMAFRVDEDSKSELMAEVDRLTNLYNDNVRDDEYLFRKNDIIIEALREGLKLLCKKETMKPSCTNKNRANSLDTIVVPTRAESFQNVFIKQNCWHPVRISKKQKSKLKYIAAYVSAPTQAITHYAKIKSIEPTTEDPTKYIIYFDGKAKEIRSIPRGQRLTMAGPIYCEYKLLKSAKSTDQLK
ncbi:MAG: hypothetical protein KAG61_09430 [Bacteriovoracaceae bacterium]|nr:hypothetical protein [Bacteriovoracaceae bacterium]